ncbi:MAG: hypothetical protein AAF602_17615 [Myxococcota bacterium]
MADLRELLLADPNVDDRIVEAFEGAARAAARTGEPQPLGDIAEIAPVKGVLTLKGLKDSELRLGWLLDPVEAEARGAWAQFFAAVARQTVGRRRPWKGIGEAWTDQRPGPTVDDRSLPDQVWLGMDFSITER